METASQILIVGGISVLFFGFLMGIPMIVARTGSPRPPRYLFAAHLVPIIQGGLLMALTVPFGFSALPSGIETLAASCLLGGMLFFTLGLVINWLQGVEDGFGEKSLGNKVSGLGTPLILGGAGIVFYGVLAAL